MDQSTEQILASLQEEHNLRTLRTSQCTGNNIVVDGVEYINLSTNDYLGLSGDIDLQREFFSQLDIDTFLMSNPSSRLMTGNSPHYDELEKSIENLYDNKRALVLSNGYAVNSGVLPAITDKSDLIIADKLSHASLIDGLRLCEAKWIRFSHNDMDHLRSLLEKNRAQYNRVWIVTESVFSMDGDTAPLAELVELKKEFDLNLYLDEAHGFGVFGKRGAGYADELALAEDFDIIIATLGKAMASVGAFVLCSAPIRELLINRMRTLIFSTALPPINLMWSKFLIDRSESFAGRRERLRELIKIVDPINTCGSSSQIIPVMTYDNLTTERVAQQMRDAGFWVTPIRTPTVPIGKARIRVSLSATTDCESVKKFVRLCNDIG